MLAILIAFSGFIIGNILKKFTEQEVKQYKKYFILIKKISLIFISISLLIFAKGYSWLLAGAIFGYLLSSLLKEYFFLGLALVISSLISKDLLLFNSTFTFIYGLAHNSFKYESLIFFIPLIFLFIPVNLAFLIGLTASALIYFIIK